jgi:hypothetical protein
LYLHTQRRESMKKSDLLRHVADNLDKGVEARTGLLHKMSIKSHLPLTISYMIVYHDDYEVDNPKTINEEDV